MKIQGVIGLAEREYIGIYDGAYQWIHFKYMIGIQEGGVVRDYKTGETYKYIPRDKDGFLMTKPSNLEEGNRYIVEVEMPRLKRNYKHRRELDNFINKSIFFNEEYKNLKAIKPKQLIK